MTAQHTTLHHNDWLSLIKMTDPDNGVGGYVYSHETRCNGQIVAILPYRENEDGWREYLVRSEITPCWGMAPSISSITGGVEDDQTPADNALQELAEEGGYTIRPDQLISLGTCRATKSTDSTYHLFTADVTGMVRGDASGDGSELEAKAHCYWTTDPCKDAVDPFLYVLYVRIGERSA